eukprot:jgi/Tetstr1/444341/TSEL_032232.t1
MMSDVNSDLEALAFMVEHTIDELRAATDARNVAKTKAEEARASSLPTLEAALAATELNLVARGADFQRSNDNYMKYNLAPMSRRGGAPAPAAAAPTAAKDPDVGEKRKRALRSKEQVLSTLDFGELHVVHKHNKTSIGFDYCAKGELPPDVARDPVHADTTF